MCGIAGVLRLRPGSGRDARQELIKVRDHMASRGPDGAGVWWSDDGHVGLAHRRLAIIDLDDRALQPLHAYSRTIVFNGEIYNYRELREELAARRPHAFTTESDTEVILALYDAYGPAMVHKLRGMFAIAIWDPAEQSLFLARDPYGIKPLYYTEADGCFYFASQVKALRRIAAVSSEAEPAGMIGFQLFGSLPEPYTLYKAIRSLPAGSTMLIDGTGVGSPTAYASIAQILAGTGEDRMAPVENVVADAMRDSIRAHLVADVEVGTFLSAGVDSGALLGLMRDCGQNRVRAVTLAFEELRGSEIDEAPLAAQVARQYGAEHHIRTVTGDEFRASAEQIIADMDQPSVDGINTWFVSKAASECGLKVVLSGLGGDELLAGYSTFTTVPRTRTIGRIAAGIPFAARFGNFALKRFAPDLVRSNPKALGVLNYGSSWAGSYLLRRAVLLPFELDRTLDAETVREGLARLDPLGLIGRALEPEPRSAIARVSALESTLYMRNQLLRDSDWASMAHSLELRVPFVDWPTLQKIAPIMPRLSPGVGKAALAHAPSSPLPAASLSRARSGFNIPVANWIGATSATRDRLASRHWSGRVSSAFGVPALAVA